MCLESLTAAIDSLTEDMTNPVAADENVSEGVDWVGCTLQATFVINLPCQGCFGRRGREMQTTIDI